MPLSPTSLLQRLQQLKVWQETHDKTLNLGETSNNITTFSDYQTIEGLSAFDTPNRSRDESKQISPSNKPFRQLLSEENLSQNTNRDDEACDGENKPKRPFLRKGTGLVRYKMKQKPPIKPRKSVKNKSAEIKDNSGITSLKVTEIEDDSGITPLKVPEISMKPKATWVHVSETPLQSEPSEQTLYEKALEKELMIFEALETRADNSSFCSTNSSVLRILSSTPSKIKENCITDVIHEEKRVHWDNNNDDDRQLPDKNNPNLHQLLLRLQTITEQHRNNNQDNNYYSSSESLSTTVSSTDFESTLKKDVGNTGSDCSECENDLKTQIDQYQQKIEALNQQKSEMEKIEKDLMRRKHEFQQEMVKKRRDFDEERRGLLFELEEERKQLVKEKTAFQTCLKNAESNKPTKKERAEISSLKQELADLKEICKMKDSKSGMSQARLRNQVKQLEKETFNLKEQIDKLTKENAKLAANQKVNRRNSEAKMLQEINKNVTKLAQKVTEIEKVEEKETKSTQNISNHMRSITDSFKSRESVGKLDESGKKTDKTETLLEDGSKEIKYSNGNVKIISNDGNNTIMKYFNGDVKQTNLFDGTIKYYYEKTDSWQTTYPDGSEIVEFNDGSKEKRFPDGTCEVHFPDGIKQTVNNDGTQEIVYLDGSHLIIQNNGEKILELPNGQKEIQAKDHTRREYPDGTVKILYPNGSQETRYSNGRVRIKDSTGKLLLDNQGT